MTHTQDHDTERYAQQLLLALRGREVPSERIAEVVAEVESHVSETGEDPREAFGSPSAYAATVAGARTFGWRTAIAVAVGALAGYTAAEVTFTFGRGADDVHGIPVGTAAVVAVALVALTAVLAQRHHRPVIDPRDGSRRLSGGGWPTVAAVAACLVVVAALAVLTRLL
jgi:hypothetical protein